jgi:uncharacterized membrane protein YfcA
MAQVLVAAASGVVAHSRLRAVHGELAWVGGGAMAASSFAGAIASRYLNDRLLLLVFALMTSGALALLLLPLGAGAAAGALPAAGAAFPAAGASPPVSGAVPVPDTCAVLCPAAVAPSVTVSVARRGPASVGVNCTPTSHVWPAGPAHRRTSPRRS